MHTMESLDKSYKDYFKFFMELAPPKFTRYGYDSGRPNGMAASLESLIYFANIVKDTDALILNAGAGASSWVLRQLFPRVICADPDAEYLDLIRELCRKHGLQSQGFVHLLRNTPDIDYTFYDYGHYEVRWPMLSVAWSKTRKSMYVDDADDRPHNMPNRHYALALAQELSIATEDCRQAIDGYGRWGILYHR